MLFWRRAVLRATRRPRSRRGGDRRGASGTLVTAYGHRQPAARSASGAGFASLHRDPWLPGALDGVADGSPVVVLGSGLTMLDVAITVTGAHPETVVHAVSRHALLPREHRYPPGRALQPPALQPADLSPVDLPGLIRRVRVAAAESPDGWQAVVDALWPHVPGLWQRLSSPDSASSSATSPATGRCTATACRPRPLGGSTSSGPRAGSRYYAVASSRSATRRRACASGSNRARG